MIDIKRNILGSLIELAELAALTTKGDILSYSTTHARLAVGANTLALVADSAEATGLKWGWLANLVAIGTSVATAQFDTSSAPDVDITNPATLTLTGLTAAHTYTILAFAQFRHSFSTGGEAGGSALDITGTQDGQVQTVYAGVNEIGSLMSVKTGVTNVTTAAIKLVYTIRTAAGTYSIIYAAGYHIAKITAMAIRTA